MSVCLRLICHYFWKGAAGHWMARLEKLAEHIRMETPLTMSIHETPKPQKIPLVRPIAARGWIDGLLTCICCFPRRRILTALRKRILVGIALFIFLSSLFQVMYPDVFAQGLEWTLRHIPVIASDYRQSSFPNGTAFEDTKVPVEPPAIYPAQEGSMVFNVDMIKSLSIQAFGSMQVVLDVRLIPENMTVPKGHFSVSYVIHSASLSPKYPIHVASSIFRTLANVTLLHQNQSDPTAPLPISERVTIGMSVFLPSKMSSRTLHLNVSADNMVVNVNLPESFKGISTFTTDINTGGMKLNGLNVINATLKADKAPIYGNVIAERNVTVMMIDGILGLNTTFSQRSYSKLVSGMSGWTSSSHENADLKQGAFISVAAGVINLRCMSYDALEIHSVSARLDIEAFPKTAPNSISSSANATILTHVKLRRGLMNLNVHAYTGLVDAEANLGRVTVQGQDVHLDPAKTNPLHAIGYVGSEPGLANGTSFLNAFVSVGTISLLFRRT